MPGHTLSEVYVHLVWAIKGRRPLLAGAVERLALRTIECEAQRKGCVVLALGGTDDHVHLLVKVPSTLALDAMVHQVKGASSRAVSLADPETWFGWQIGYGAFSVSPSHRARVVRYITEQRARHAAGDLWATIEATSDADAHR